MFNHKTDDNVEVYGKYLPSTGLGGDCYDTITIKDKTWFMIADIMGHGVASAMVSFMVKALFNQLATYDLSPKDLLESMNATYCSMMEKYNEIIFSIFVGTIHNDELIYSSAGHPYPILYKKSKKEASFLKRNDTLMGISSDTTFHDSKVNIESEDLIFLYTDGLYERSKSMHSIDTVMNYLHSYESLLSPTPVRFINKILERLTMNKAKNDDIAILTIKKK
nr:PP2C family protein-serine/threonine phosphatase [Anaeromonas frigoriresistens]